MKHGRSETRRDHNELESRSNMSRFRSLTPHEQQTYDVVDPQLAARVRVVDIPFIPGGYSGITLGRFVCLADPQPTTGTSTLLAHELVHVQQLSLIHI